MDNQRENRLRTFLEKFITLHKTRAVYLGGRGKKPKLYLDLWSSWKFSVLYWCASAGVDASQNQKKILFFSWPPIPLEIELFAPGGDPTGSQVCQRTLKRFRSTPS